MEHFQIKEFWQALMYMHGIALGYCFAKQWLPFQKYGIFGKG